MNETSAQIGTAAILLAAGRGERSGHSRPKQYVELCGEPVLRRTIRAFQASPVIDLIQVVIHPDDAELYDAAVAGLPALPAPVPGSETRQGSVLQALEALQPVSPQTVLIHDAARPFVSGELLERVAAGVGPGQGASPAIAVTDTLRRGVGELLTDTVPREQLFTMQTPQAFPYRDILEAHRKAAQIGQDHLTDDAAVFQLFGQKVSRVAGERGNMKLTRPEDFAYAERMIATTMETRTGQGFDVHAFGSGDAVWLCGVQIPFERNLKGHSDADVGLHALTDAIFGALADGDIGSHFPPSDPQWKGTASDVFLRHAMERLAQRGGRLINLDVTLVCEAPKIGPYRDKMRSRIAEICDVDVGRVAVKATTSERLGFTGRGEGIAAMAAVTVALPAEQ